MTASFEIPMCNGRTYVVTPKELLSYERENPGTDVRSAIERVAIALRSTEPQPKTANGVRRLIQQALDAPS